MPYARPLRDHVYFAIITLQLAGMLVLDLVPLYPKSLYQSPTAPLHFLAKIQALYASHMGDPYYIPGVAHERWLLVFLVSEAFVQLPLAAYAWYNLVSKGSRAVSGHVELATLVLAVIVSLSSTVCVVDLWCMGPERVSAGHQRQLVYGAYGPFAVIYGAMAVDMYMRLLGRLRGADSKAKTA